MKKGKRPAQKNSRPGRLRIVAGKWRSRLLPIADEPGLRPTSDRVRETLFNWLGDRIVGSRCLDLFAGTGALGFEALSRGAASVTFVESSARAAEGLRMSSTLLETDKAVIESRDAHAFLSQDSDGRYDIVFLDPPFAGDLLEESCRLLQSNDRLQPGAMIYLEFPRDRQLPSLPQGWQVKKDKTAGNVRFVLASPGED